MNSSYDGTGLMPILINLVNPVYFSFASILLL